MTNSNDLTFYRYSPENMEEGVLRKLFVGREAQFDSIFEKIEESARKKTPSFDLIVGPRGIGKSHFLSLLYYDIKSKLDSQLIPVKLAEEEYSIFRASDLFIRILEVEEEDTSDILSLDKDDDVLYAALEKLKQISKREKKRYIIFVENLHEMFKQLDKEEVTKLRLIFKKHDIFSVVATAPIIFSGVSDKNEPFFKFFSIQHLNELSLNEIKTLIKKIAETEGNNDFLDEFEKYEEKIHGMEHLTGGSPRLVILFYEMITRGELENVEKAFLKIVDEHTPYYQEIFQLLSGQRRKIFDIVISAGKPVTPKEISKDARISIQTVTTQLRRLEGDGYVRSRPEGRHTKYEVRERLFRLWREMRQPLGRKRITVLLEFLQYWYTPDERNELFTAKFALLEAGEKTILKEVCYFAEALTTEFKTDALLKLTPKLIQMGELEDAAHEISKLRETVVQTKDKSLESKILLHEGQLMQSEKRYEDSLEIFNKLLAINPKDKLVLSNIGSVLLDLGKYEKAIKTFDKVLEINSKDEFALKMIGGALLNLDRYEEALDFFKKNLLINPNDNFSLFSTSYTLNLLGKYENALVFIEKGLETNPINEGALSLKESILMNLKRFEEQLEISDYILKINPKNESILLRKGITLEFLERHEEALEVIETFLEINPINVIALSLKGTSLVNLGLNEEALEVSNKALEKINNGDFEPFFKAFTLSSKGVALANLGNYEEALEVFDNTLKFFPIDGHALRLKASMLLKLKRYDESLDAALKVIDSASNEYDKIYASLIMISSYLSLDRKSEAILEIENINEVIINQKPDLIEEFIEISLNLVLSELKLGNSGNANKFMKMAYSADSKHELDGIIEYTMIFLKAAADSGLSVVKAAVDEILKLKGDTYSDKIKPITKAIEIVETKDMKKYYDLQVEEREIVADIVRKITKSDNLIPEEIKRKERS